MKKRSVYVAVAAVGALVAALVSYAWLARSGSPSQPSATAPPTSPRASGTLPVSTLDPITIESMRSRSYPASTLTVERVIGDQGGYISTVASYQSDGLRVHALVSVPDGAKPAKGWPVIILCHGYVDPAQYRTVDGSYSQFIAAFAAAGYMVVKPDFRGNGQSQGVPEGGHFSPVYAYDVLNLISTLKADSRAAPGRIGIFAHSMGGHEALRAAVVSRDVKVVVLMAGVVGSFYDIFYNWPNSPVTTDRPVQVQQARAALIAEYGTPQANPAFWDSASAINFVGSTSAAFQINHDIGDSVVPKTFSDHLASALTAAGKTADYQTYPGDDHQFVQNRATILSNAAAFYRAHL